MKEQTEYDKQAADFCAATGLTIKKQYTGHRPYFAGEKESRAVWSITFERPGRKPYIFTYGDSITNSWQQYRYLPTGKVKEPGPLGLGSRGAMEKGGGRYQNNLFGIEPVHPEPSDYDVLACIQKRGNLSFQDFCDNYGYDSDSIKARDIWIACNEQAAAIESMFSDKEIETLEEIV